MKTNQENLESIAFVDDLTGLKNIHSFFRDFEGKDLSNTHFINVDVDNISLMSAIFGVDAIDNVLSIVGETLKEYCGHSEVYKVGNEQFVIVTDSHIICEPSELRKLLRQPVKRNKSSYIIKASISVLDYDDFKGDSFEDIVKLLRFSMHYSKKRQKNSLYFVTQKTKKRFLETTEIEEHIFDAVRLKEFFPKFQPFVDTFTNKIVGFETVTRWDLHGIVLKPNKFLEIAEWTGLIYPIEIEMFKHTLTFLQELRQNKEVKLSKGFKASVNFSAHTLNHVKVHKLIDLTNKCSCKPSDIIIEIKESYITDESAYEKVKELHANGFLIALDDYTNTSSSLTYLADLKVDILKLSECLLDKVDTNQEYTKMFNIYKFMSDIGKKFDLTIVSAGINNAENVKLAKSLQINIGSGKYFSKAVYKDDFIELFNTLKVKRG